MTRLHIHLRCTDLEASRAFYTALLGAPDKQLPELTRFQPAGVGVTLSLMSGTPRPLHPEEHFGLKAPDSASLKALWERIEGAGLEPVRVEEAVACCAAVQDKKWFADPDGRPWEVYTVLDDTITQLVPEPVVEDEACCAPSCCA